MWLPGNHICVGDKCSYPMTFLGFHRQTHCTLPGQAEAMVTLWMTIFPPLHAHFELITTHHLQEDRQAVSILGNPGSHGAEGNSYATSRLLISRLVGNIMLPS